MPVYLPLVAFALVWAFAICFALLSERGARGWSRMLLALAVVPAAVVWLAIPDEGYQNLRLRFQGEGFRVQWPQDDAGEFLVGGGRDGQAEDTPADDFLVRGVIPNFLRFAKSPDSPEVTLTIRQSQFDDVTSAVSWRKRFGEAMFPRTWRIENELRFCFGPSGACGPKTQVTMTRDGELWRSQLASADPNTSAVDACSIQPRTIGGFNVGRQLPPQKEIYPLATYGRAKCAGEALQTAKRTLKSFAHRGRSAEGFFITVLDEGVTVFVDGKKVDATNRPLILKPDVPDTMRIFRIRAGNVRSVQFDDSVEHERSHLRELRSFAIGISNSGDGTLLDLRLDTASVTDITPSTLRANRGNPLPSSSDTKNDEYRTALRLAISPRGSSASTMSADVMPVPMNFIGESIARSIYNEVQVSSQNNVRLVDLDMPRQLKNGELFYLGDKIKLAVRYKTLPSPAWALWALSGFLLAIGLLRMLSNPPLIIFPALVLAETLLAFRALASLESAYIDYKTEPLVVGALMAVMWLPWVLEVTAIALLGKSIMSTCARLLLLIPASVFVLWRHAGGFSDVQVIAVGVVILAALITIAFHKFVRRLHQRFSDNGRFIGTLDCLIPIGLVILHFSIIFLGYKERISFVPVATTMLLLWTLALARIVNRAEWRDVRQGWWLVVFSFLVPIGYIAFPLLGFGYAKDIGFAIYSFGMLAFVSFWSLFYVMEPGLNRRWWQPGLIVCVSHVVVAAVTWWVAMTMLARMGIEAFAVAGGVGLVACLVLSSVIRPIIATWSLALTVLVTVVLAISIGAKTDSKISLPTSNEATQAFLKKQSDVDVNDLRLLRLINPDLQDAYATREAEGMASVLEEMALFASPKSGGRGFLGGPPVNELAQTHVNDTVLAVHLVSPYGRETGLALVFLLGVLAFQTMGSRLRPKNILSQAGRIGSVVLFVTGLYMFLANIEWVPFTGRNFPYLVFQSGADILETTALFALVLIALIFPWSSLQRTPS